MVKNPFNICKKKKKKKTKNLCNKKNFNKNIELFKKQNVKFSSIWKSKENKFYLQRFIVCKKRHNDYLY